MEMICISSFDRWGRITGISFNKIYKVKYAHAGKLLITNDFGRPQMVIYENFLYYNDVKTFL